MDLKTEEYTEKCIDGRNHDWKIIPIIPHMGEFDMICTKCGENREDILA
jgi:hypothetical protein